MTPGDQMLHIINVASLQDMSIRDYMTSLLAHSPSAIPSSITVERVEDLAARYQDFKIGESVYDYTDMLIMAKTADFEVPELKYLLIDEAQDLSSLQWMLVNRLAEKAEHIIIAGDDKQTINEFAGADVDTFLSLPGKVESLEQSYRVPKAVFNLANKIMGKMKKYRREGARWKPREEEGTVRYCAGFPLSKIVSGKWLVLARTGVQLEKIKDRILEYCQDFPVLFTVNGMPPIDTDMLRMIQILNLIRQPGCNKSLLDLVTITDKDTAEEKQRKRDYIVLFKKFISHRSNLKKYNIDTAFQMKLMLPWYKAMDKVDPATLRYAKALMTLWEKKGDAMFDDAPIRLMTIHAAKGREEDNVVVCTDVTSRIKKAILTSESDVEMKTLYVAVTRAKQNLYIYGHDSNNGTLKDFLS